MKAAKERAERRLVPEAGVDDALDALAAHIEASADVGRLLSLAEPVT